MGRTRALGRFAALGFILFLPCRATFAGTPDVTYGPYNVTFPAGGGGQVRPLTSWGGEVRAPAGGAWTLQAWVRASEIADGRALIAGLGDPADGGRFLALDGGRPALWTPRGDIAGGTPMTPGQWRFIVAVCDGARIRLFVDGVQVAQGAPPNEPAAAVVQLAPRHVAGASPFAGDVAGFTALPRALSDREIAALYARRPDFALTVFDAGAPTWPVQIHGMAGLTAPQDPWTLPRSASPPSTPTSRAPYDGPSLVAEAGQSAWTLPRWSMIEAPKTTAGGTQLSQPGFDAGGWYAATVPGTVLTTLVDRGVYPDPEIGLNNMAIPESLARQDYWYRSEFPTPAGAKRRFARLTFKGINYAAEVWLNGERLGDIKGAFIRGRFDVRLKDGGGAINALAVRISPPPHPGIPHEQSLAAGAGENGGMQALDGPTFFATEGWDWIPGVRDRNAGLWQDVVLSLSGPVRLGDAQVVTTLPKPDNSEADVEITVPVENLASRPVETVVTASFDDVSLSRTVSAAPGRTLVRFTPAEFAALKVAHPRLWWPNGYGEPALHTLHLSLAADGANSDSQDVRFGMRQITCELSLMDSAGHLRRVEIDPARARQLGQPLTDGRHEAIRKSADGWVASLTAGAEASPAVRGLPDTTLSPFLVIKVNGVRIAARGGSWGMDDWRKRVSRERLEPYFRLHREAHLNIIRNWVGQNTEDVFYDLADEYGLLVLNDFWESTQDFQLEADDVPLFLANAADVVSRYRNHPSIALWFGRNEGVPQPVLNEGLQRLINDLDGTRYYSASSNRVNLQDSGPYNYRDPAGYFTTYAKGFAVEVGTPSFPTLEAFEAIVAPKDRWPISDAWAYHDWHQDGNGATQSFMTAMTARLGAPTGLEDFERKAQLMNFDTYRAIFEGMNAQLWTGSSGRMLWMTQPAWPSTMWQIYSHDFDTHAAFYGVKAAAEPVHVQLSPPDQRVELVNNTLAPITGAIVQARIVSLAGKPLAERRFTLDVAPDDVSHGQSLDVGALLASEGALIVSLEANGADGAALSRNLYWLTRDDDAARALSAMAPQPITLTARLEPGAPETHVAATVTNAGPAPALNLKLTLLSDKGERILPAYYSDNYVSLLPGESRVVDIAFPNASDAGAVHVALRGWNAVATQTMAVH
jgi:hypothetical protein